MKGFKVFNPDWTCRDFQYSVGGTFQEDVNLSVCNSGFHFCKVAADCFNYYTFNSENKVAEVIAHGDIAEDGDKCATNKIEIVREVTWQELLSIVNTGKDCTGLCNTGNRNTGNRNTGNRNTGNRNTGNRNTGDCNTGNRNTGNRNTGDWNTGNRNTGNRNTGDWNRSAFNTGCFNTMEGKISFFDEPSDWSYINWYNSDARHLLNNIPSLMVEWVCTYEMSDEEKVAHPEYETTEGYLKVMKQEESAQIWYDGLVQKEKNLITNLPNFDPVKFEVITGIKVDEN